MENKDIVQGNIGSIGVYDVEFRDGKLVAKVGIAAVVAGQAVELGGDVHVAISAKIASDAILDGIAKLIPGDSAIEKTLIDGAKALVGKYLVA